MLSVDRKGYFKNERGGYRKKDSNAVMSDEKGCV